MEFATSKRRRRRRRPSSSSEYPSRCGHDGAREYQYACSTLGTLGAVGAVGKERELAPRRAERIRRRRTNAVVLPNALLMLSLGTASVLARPAPAFVAPSLASRNGRHRSEGSIPKRASLFVSVEHHLTSNFSPQHNRVKSKKYPARQYNADDDGDDDDDKFSRPLTLQPAALVRKLNSFSSNISRLRAARKKRGPPASSEKKRGVKENDDALIGACTSLLHFLRDEAVKLSSSPPSVTAKLVNEATVGSTRETLEMVLVQSIRASSELGDFAILIKLAHAAAEYAEAVSAAAAAGNAGLLSSRVFGEAVSSLSRTKASLSKVKSLWSHFLHEVPRSSLSSPPSAYELNAMLASLRERGKASAALKVYRQAIVATAVEGGDEAGAIEGDAYTASILFGTLADSASSVNANVVGGSGRHGRYVSTEKRKSSGPLSPCWQWNEAIALLGTFAPDRLNNHAYAMLLKVNEKATEAYGTVDNGSGRHDGVRCAMSVLERMKVSFLPHNIGCPTFDVFDIVYWIAV